MKGYTVKEAAEKLGISPEAARQRLYSGSLQGRKLKRGWVVYLNGNEPATEKPPAPDISDELTEIGDELIAIGRRLKRAIKEHDAEVRRETIIDFAASIAEAAEKGR
jgi:DNA-binding Lrp family transcriptional regulator